MKKINIKFFIVTAITLFLGCNDEFMEKYPQDEVTIETYFNTAEDLQLWINGLYEYTASNNNLDFAKYFENGNTTAYLLSNILIGNGGTRAFNTSVYSQFHRDMWTDNYATKDSYVKMNTSAMLVKTGNSTVPTSAWDLQYPAGWWWYLYRPIALFLDNYDKADIEEDELKKYIGQVKMWRAWFYYDKVSHFGDVPMVLNTPNVTDTAFLSGTRTPRAEVMAQVLEDINYACENMSEDYGMGDPGWMNKWAAYALKARICLFEGTWLKYHGTGTTEEIENWLSEAASAAEAIINSGNFSLYSTGDSTSDYRNFHLKTDYSGNSEVIYWKQYIDGMNANGVHYWYRINGATRSAVEDYLCDDGLPINLSTRYMGDDSIESVFVNRDPRLRQTILHPDDVEKFDYGTNAALPYPRLTGMSEGIILETGYHEIKHYNRDWYSENYKNGELGAIIFGLAEVYLNYAEAKAELGTLTQSDLDNTINKLRDRVGMPHLALNPEMDTRYSNWGVSSLLVEIRRERRIELFAEGYRYDDLRRWKLLVSEGSKLAARQGILWDNKASARYSGASIKTSEAENGKTYVDVFKGTGNEQFNLTEKHYLFPILETEVAQCSNLGQTPGWE